MAYIGAIFCQARSSNAFSLRDSLPNLFNTNYENEMKEKEEEEEESDEE
jgi:ferredoxin